MAILRSALLAPLLLFAVAVQAQARFDLAGPKIDVRVTRAGVELPIAAVPNLQPGDRIWLHPDLPATQSVHYLLIATFLRGTTNPPPDEWFTRIETWNRKVREEGVSITVPNEAQQAVLFLAPETGGDFSTLRSAVKGRPGVFVRASQDLTEAGFEQARINTYLASIKLVPPSDPAALLEHSNLLARTLTLKPNADCFKRPVDQQYNCLTQTGSQTLLDDGHGQSIVNALSTGSGSDFINAASTTRLAAGGNYSAYVGALVDLVRLTSGLHTAQYQYIPGLSTPDGPSLNLSLNMAPSFHNPKSVIVIGLPSIQKAVPPPLRPPDPAHISCLLNPKLVLPVEGAPLVFTSGFAHGLTLHLNLPAGTALPGVPAGDLPLIPDAFQGGLTVQKNPSPRHELMPDPAVPEMPTLPEAQSATPKTAPSTLSASLPAPPEPLTGTLEGMWGFDHFTGPTLTLQGTPGTGWHIVPSGSAEHLIAGAPNSLVIDSSGTACIQHIELEAANGFSQELTWKLQSLPHSASPEAAAPEAKDAGAMPSRAEPAHFRPVDLTLDLQEDATPGTVQLSIQQFSQPKADHLETRTFAEPAVLSGLRLHAGDLSVQLLGKGLEQVKQLTIDQVSFVPIKSKDAEPDTLELDAPKDAPLKAGEHFGAKVELRDGRILSVSGTTLSARPQISILSRRVLDPAASPFALPSAPGKPIELPLGAQLIFFLKSAAPFSRNGSIELAGPDEALRKTLTLKDGLVLQDAHTLLATIDPLKFFGPSTFGLFRIRAVLPEPKPDGAIGDWLPLATVVRLPTLSSLTCPSDATQPCHLAGQSLYLIDSVSATPDFASSTAVPEGFVETSLAVPHPTGPSFYLRLRDNPTDTVQATLPITPEPVAPKAKAMAAATSAPGVLSGSHRLR